MTRRRIAAWAATLVTAYMAAGGIFAGAAGTTAGNDCARPITVRFTPKDLPRHGDVTKGGVRIFFSHEDKRDNFADVGGAPSRQSSRWRTCEARGVDGAGRRWRVPAPVGPRGGYRRGEPSATGRAFYTTNPESIRRSVGTFRFSIARIAPDDGRSCARPYTVLEFVRTEFVDGDKRYATLKTKTSGSDLDLTVSWAPRGGTVVCEMGAIVHGNMIVRRVRKAGSLTFPGRQYCDSRGGCHIGANVQAVWVSVRKPTR